jgi:hypothetical protein
MAKIKLIKSSFEEDGSSYAFIETKYGIFMGNTKLHEEDKDIQSDFVGCHIAEYKARIKYEKEKLIELKKKNKVLKSLVTDMERLNGYEKNNLEARFVRKQYYLSNETIQNQKEKIKVLKDNLLYTIQNYRQEKENFDKKIIQLREKRNKKQEATEE